MLPSLPPPTSLPPQTFASRVKNIQVTLALGPISNGGYTRVIADAYATLGISKREGPLLAQVNQLIETLHGTTVVDHTH